jgi:hypothetical protein
MTTAMVREVSPTLSELCGKSSSSGPVQVLRLVDWSWRERYTIPCSDLQLGLRPHLDNPLTRIISLLYLLLWSIYIIPISTLRIPQTLNLHPSRKESPPSQSESTNLPHSLSLPGRTSRRSTEGALGSVRICRGRECGTGRCRDSEGGKWDEGGDLAKEGRGEGSQGTEGLDRCCHQGRGEAEEEVQTGQGDW